MKWRELAHEILRMSQEQLECDVAIVVIQNGKEEILSCALGDRGEESGLDRMSPVLITGT